eukprot:5950329-Pleurochrysis_carterae.AAC.1
MARKGILSTIRKNYPTTTIRTDFSTGRGAPARTLAPTRWHAQLRASPVLGAEEDRSQHKCPNGADGNHAETGVDSGVPRTARPINVDLNIADGYVPPVARAHATSEDGTARIKGVWSNLGEQTVRLPKLENVSTDQRRNNLALAKTKAAISAHAVVPFEVKQAGKMTHFRSVFA